MENTKYNNVLKLLNLLKIDINASIQSINSKIKSLIERKDIQEKDFKDWQSKTYEEFKAKVDLLKPIKGERGLRGIQGEKGEKGDTGTKGERGERGLTGLRGLKGEAGKDGKDGKNGKDGITTTIIKEEKLSPEEIRDKLESINEEEEKLSVKAIGGLDKILKDFWRDNFPRTFPSGGGGAVIYNQLSEESTPQNVTINRTSGVISSVDVGSRNIAFTRAGGAIQSFTDGTYTWTVNRSGGLISGITVS